MKPCRRHFCSLLFVCLLGLFLFGHMCFAQERQLCIHADERVELMATVQYLSGYFLTSRYPTNYKKEIKQRFATYKNHPAVTLFAQLSHDHFSYSEPFKFILQYNNIPYFEAQYDTEFSPVSAGQADSLVLFANLLQDFYKKTQFGKFFDQHQPLYDTLSNQISQQLGNTNYIALLENYFGKQQADYELIFSPLLPNGGFGPAVKLLNNQYILYALVGANGIDKGIPTFDAESFATNLLLHEFSHSFINPLTEKNIIALNKCDNLYAYVANDMAAKAYDRWDIVINEHLVRAAVIRIAQKQFGTQTANALIEREKQAGFLYIEPVINALVRYENRRQKYPTFERYYPEIIKLFEQLSNSIESK